MEDGRPARGFAAELSNGRFPVSLQSQRYSSGFLASPGSNRISYYVVNLILDSFFPTKRPVEMISPAKLVPFAPSDLLIRCADAPFMGLHDLCDADRAVGVIFWRQHHVNVIGHHHYRVRQNFLPLPARQVSITI